MRIKEKGELREVKGKEKGKGDSGVKGQKEIKGDCFRG